MNIARLVPNLRRRADWPLLAAAILAGLLASTEAALVHRWSFSNANGNAAAGTAISDPVGLQNAVVPGVGASFANGVLTLPGSTTGNEPPAAVSAYIDLPNGLISSKTNLTVEIWATPLSHQGFQRLLDFGRVNVAGDGLGAVGEITGGGAYDPNATQASDGLTLTLSRDASLNQQRFEGKLDGNGNTADPLGRFRQADTNLTTTAGTKYHYVMTFEDGVGAFGATGGRLSWYRDGTLAAAFDLGFRLSQIEDVNNWLGRSLWSNDRGAHASYDEVRLYNHAFTAAELAASRAADPSPAAPVAQPDAITLHAGQKASIAVLANDTAAVSPLVVQQPQFGTAVADAYGRIRYAHTTGSPAGDSFTYRAANAAGQSAATTVTVTFSPNLRLANNAVNVPATPPPTSYQLVDAFPGLAFEATAQPLTDPVCMATPPGETQRLFICQKNGVLRLVRNVNAPTANEPTFLNLAALLTSRGQSISTATSSALISSPIIRPAISGRCTAAPSPSSGSRAKADWCASDAIRRTATCLSAISTATASAGSSAAIPRAASPRRSAPPACSRT